MKYKRNKYPDPKPKTPKEHLPGELPLKHKLMERFCQEYLVDLKLMPAFKRAGYKRKSKYSKYPYNLIARTDVQKRISYLKWQRAKRTEINADNVVREIANIAFFNIKDLYDDYGKIKDISSLSREETAAISGIDVLNIKNDNTLTKIHFKGKREALVNLANHLGILQDKTNAIDPALYELKVRKANLQNLSTDDLVDLVKIFKKATNVENQIEEKNNSEENETKKENNLDLKKLGIRPLFSEEK